MTRRPIDRAMAEERLEKATIREIWLKFIQSVPQKNANQDHPLYVTLSGAEGKDIEGLVHHGILKKTENGAISADDEWKVVAIEKNGPAATKLRKKFPGLKVIHDDVLELIGGTSETSFPEDRSDDSKLWLADVINLDYNSTFSGSIQNGRGLFSVAQTLKKIATIQHQYGKQSWCLLVTLNATLNLEDDCWGEIQRILNDNFNSVEEFREAFSKLVPLSADSEINSDILEEIKGNCDLQQKLLMAFLPKIFAQKIRDYRWKFDVEHALVYGDNSYRQARMASWIICLKKPESPITDEACYQKNVKDIMKNCSKIESTGCLTPFS